MTLGDFVNDDEVDALNLDFTDIGEDSLNYSEAGSKLGSKCSQNE